MTWKTLPTRARTLFYMQAFARLGMYWVPVCLVAFFGLSYLLEDWKLATALAGGWFFLQFLLAAVMPWLAHERWAYIVRDRDLLISSGVFFRTITAIPANRIQHVDLKQDVLEQWMKLTRLHIYTASGMGADGAIPGLEAATAEALRDELVAVQGDDGV